LLQGGAHPEDVELAITGDDPFSPSRQWLLGSVEHGCHAWCGTRCSGYRGAFVGEDNNESVIINWGSFPGVARKVFNYLSGAESPVAAMMRALREHSLLVPARSIYAVGQDGSQVIDFAERESALMDDLSARRDRSGVPSNIEQAWSLVSEGYAKLFHVPGMTSTEEALSLFSRAHRLDNNEVQAVLWPIIGHQQLGNSGRVAELVAELQRQLAADPQQSAREAATLLRLIDTEPAGLGISSRDTAREVADRYFGAQN
jgi:hypothetical protein